METKGELEKEKSLSPFLLLFGGRLSHAHKSGPVPKVKGSPRCCSHFALYWMIATCCPYPIPSRKLEKKSPVVHLSAVGWGCSNIFKVLFILPLVLGVRVSNNRNETSHPRIRTKTFLTMCFSHIRLFDLKIEQLGRCRETKFPFLLSEDTFLSSPSSSQVNRKENGLGPFDQVSSAYAAVSQEVFF